MNPHTPSPSQTLLTDLYQLTMAYGYWKSGLHETRAAFHLGFRTLPFHGGFALVCGQGSAREWLEEFRFDKSDCAYLATLTGADGGPLFDEGFLKYLGSLRLELDIDAVDEGEVVFGHQPLLRVEGPILHCQLVETALLSIINFQTLIATKAARVCLAARGEPVLEFGARRAQGLDGALSASRAAFVGGCAATSNVLAGKRWGIPVRGTHAHAWVMLFPDETQAFEAYAQAMPNNCTFLVDTYDTLDGVRHAVEVGRKLRENGHELAGIRLDSGDLAYLSIEARKILDEGGFPNANIVASNDLDEKTIDSLKAQGARVNVWGVGTNLVTGGDQSALGGVFKLSAVHQGGAWQPRLKLSEQTVKTSIPGRQQIRRFSRAQAPDSLEGSTGQCVADAIYDIDSARASDVPQGCEIVHPADSMRRRTIDPTREQLVSRDLLSPWFRAGRGVREIETLAQARQRAQERLSGFHPTITRLLNPHEYPAGIEESLHETRARLITEARQRAASS
jgi:nicotinate phosphoribosyltransferase